MGVDIKEALRIQRGITERLGKQLAEANERQQTLLEVLKEVGRRERDLEKALLSTKTYLSLRNTPGMNAAYQIVDQALAETAEGGGDES